MRYRRFATLLCAPNGVSNEDSGSNLFLGGGTKLFVGHRGGGGVDCLHMLERALPTFFFRKEDPPPPDPLPPPPDQSDHSGNN